MNGDIFIDVDYDGIGDRIQMASVPEAIYKWYGKKVVDINKSWIFDHNPYVIRREDHRGDLKVKFVNKGFACLYCDELDWINPDVKGTVNLTELSGCDFKMLIHSLSPPYTEHQIASSRNTWILQRLSINTNQKPELDIPRGPRLYKYENPNEVYRDQIAVHVGPSKSTDQFIPDYVLDTIKKKYSNYNIIQIGDSEDYSSPFIDKKGLNIWDSIEIIAKSAIFIGINSGPMNIANCYPHINKKLIVNTESDWTDRQLQSFEPLNARIDPSFGWVDFGWQYFTTKDYDMGRMYSYKRI
jgi:hypothetical protein